MNIDDCISHVLSDPKVTDIHLVDGGSVWFRAGRTLVKHPEGLEIDPGVLSSWLADNHFHSDPNEILKPEGDADFAITVAPYRLRAQAFLSQGVLRMAMRRLSDSLIEFSQLGIADKVLDLATRPRGIFLVTGQTGSGKSTTLAAIINYLNEHHDLHIITIEDPIEYLYRSNRCLITQREVRNDTSSFPRALRAALREDPDVILIGEIRDQETMEIALSAAETGHLVLATMHTNGAAPTLERVGSFFEGTAREAAMNVFGSVLNGIICQQRLFDRAEQTVIVQELLVPTDSIRSNIRKGNFTEVKQEMATGRRDGQILFNDSLADLVANGRLDLDTAMYYSPDPDRLKVR